ncbi:rRNA maturation RNase YbeY [Evansella sp. LMS18]|jgi:probable rRNA maturation factor|uniref:rRNA maturation RNase YbeY n=1 Tax=Evansella sp. LMS18 TaxID=2924033 RepID=UPI0020D01B05|nr:rRNA maturation RNase YbeY [Evansella sp. LMS18]UTR09359.1 rRNA maturation RNase YbeY [Evansella sp. LMS18]
MDYKQTGLIDETGELHEDMLNLVADVLDTAMEMEGINENSELSVTFVNNEQIRELNRDYRGKDEPTDVLSFALNEGEDDEVEVEGMPDLLGDIVISVPRAEQQAEEYGHDIKRELCFLAVHGFLHLLGYDHGDETQEKAMFSRQEEILEKHGLKKR